MRLHEVGDEPSGGVLYVRVDDLDGALSLEAERLGISLGQFVRRELARARWLREALSRGGRVLVEDERGLLREARYREGLR